MQDDEPQDGPSLGGRDLITLGGLLVACVVVGLVVGEFLDVWLDTSPAFVLAGIALGIVAAGAGFWLRVRSFLRP
jgi:F0F1-type ATP synthase assembly protein I